MTGCVALDGIAGHIAINGVAPVVFAGSVSWGAWVKIDGSPVVLEMILAINTAAGGNLLLHRIAAGDTAVSFVRDVFLLGGTTHATDTCVDNEWHHHAVSWDASGTGRLLYYLDGVLQFTSDVIPETLSNDDTWTIGAEYDGASIGDFLTGKIARVTVFDSALSADEVTELYESTLPTTPNKLGAIAYYAPGTHINALPVVSDASGGHINGLAFGVDPVDYREDYPQ